MIILNKQEITDEMYVPSRMEKCTPGRSRERDLHKDGGRRRKWRVEAKRRRGGTSGAQTLPEELLGGAEGRLNHSK